jgi:hypothetical protein
MLLGGGIVAFVEEEVKRLQNQSLVPFLSGFGDAACFFVSGYNRDSVTPLRHSGKKHRDGLCAFIPPCVPRPILYNHVAALQMQRLAIV